LGVKPLRQFVEVKSVRVFSSLDQDGKSMVARSALPLARLAPLVELAPPTGISGLIRVAEQGAKEFALSFLQWATVSSCLIGERLAPSLRYEKD